MPDSPFVGNMGRIRLSPLQEAMTKKGVAASSGTNAAATPSISNHDLSTGLVDGNGNEVSTLDLKDAEERAAAGDQTAIDWLKTLGLVGGVAGGAAGGYLLYKSMKGRGGQGGMTPDGVIPSQSTDLVPFNRNPDLYIDLPSSEYKAVDGYLPKQPQKRIGQSDPTLPGKPILNAIIQQEGNNYPVGRTNQSKEEDFAYMQKAFQDARAAKAGTNAAKERAYKFNKVLKSIGRIF